MITIKNKRQNTKIKRWKTKRRKDEHKIGNGSGERETEREREGERERETDREREREGKKEGRKIWTEKKKKKTP